MFDALVALVKVGNGLRVAGFCCVVVSTLVTDKVAAAVALVNLEIEHEPLGDELLVLVLGRPTNQVVLQLRVASPDAVGVPVPIADADGKGVAGCEHEELPDGVEDSTADTVGEEVVHTFEAVPVPVDV